MYCLKFPWAMDLSKSANLLAYLVVLDFVNRIGLQLLCFIGILWFLSIEFCQFSPGYRSASIYISKFARVSEISTFALLWSDAYHNSGHKWVYSAMKY